MNDITIITVVAYFGLLLIILMPFTVLVALLCLSQVGGLLTEIDTQGLSDQFALIKPDGFTPDNKYNWLWCLASFVTVFKGYFSRAACSNTVM